MKRLGGVWQQLVSFENLLLAFRKARLGKSGRPTVAQFACNLEAELLQLQRELIGGEYQPGTYRVFNIYERKPRQISAAPFRDRVVHNASADQHASLTVIPAGIAGPVKARSESSAHGGYGGELTMEKQPCVYMLASGINGTLYIGVTSNLPGRIFQHRQNLVPGFTQRYRVHHLVWYEVHEQMKTAILREKQLKNWSRKAKKRLIEMHNPQWNDLWANLA